MIKKMSPSESDFDIPAKNCYRMVILGSTKVGKTAIVSRFLNGRFEEQYTPTIEDFHRKLYNIKGDVYQLDILDTSGNHPFPAMRRLSILTGTLLAGFGFCSFPAYLRTPCFPPCMALRVRANAKRIFSKCSALAKKKNKEEVNQLIPQPQFSLQVTCSFSSSAWTTASLSRRCSGSRSRSTRPSRA